ncbi:MAG: 16S rRNA (guanine(527)-N(7))-methyltransferase RsmG [Bacillota bacterium]
MSEINTQAEKTTANFSDFSLFEKFDIFLTEKQKAQLEQYYQILIEENEKYNLTSITDQTEIYHKHFLDSMLGGKFIKENASVCDIGAGGGFPSLPLKILRPDLSFTLCDSRGKKVAFLQMACDKLGLDKMTPIHSRIEELAHSKKRASFDVVVSRGVAPLPTLLEYKMPLVKMGGIALCFKGDVEKEIEISKNAISLLHCHKMTVHKLSISESQNERSFLIVEKSVESPRIYPRGKNLPRLNPL